VIMMVYKVQHMLFVLSETDALRMLPMNISKKTIYGNYPAPAGLVAAVACITALSGCIAMPAIGDTHTVEVSTLPPAQNIIAQYAESASKSLRDLAEVNAAAAKLSVQEGARSRDASVSMGDGEATPTALTKKASFHFTGDIEDLVMRVVGGIDGGAGWRASLPVRKPTTPIIVTIDASAKTLFDILREGGAQCGSRADVIIDPINRVVAVRYQAGRKK
jgi:hypothetical protein